MVDWKENSNGSTALLIEGARRIGKSTIVEEFARIFLTEQHTHISYTPKTCRKTDKHYWCQSI